MKKTILVTSLAMVFGLSACHIKNPDDVNKDLQKQLNEDQKQNDDLADQLQKSMEGGGQPGSIKVSGIIVKDNTTTDSRITILSRAGIGKDGTPANLGRTTQPQLSSKNEKLDLSKLAEQKNLISLGCDGKTVDGFAKDQSLEIQKLPAPASEGVLTISAKTIVLCGHMDKINTASLRGSFITFNADELILDQVDYSLIGMNGSLVFNANKLLLQGTSQIATKGFDSSLTLPLTPSLEFNVLKEISSSEDGKLVLKSAGSDYKADSK